MSDTVASLRRKIGGAGDLQSVVRTMKTVAAASVGQYEQSVSALADFYRAVELGLSACFRESGPAPLMPERKTPGHIGAVVFGSDQGLVGQFNDVVADYAVKTLAALAGKREVWAVGERVHERLAEARQVRGEIAELHLFYNRPKSGAYEPVSQRLLPLDEAWRHKLAARPWPTSSLPEVIGGGIATLGVFLRGYLFVSIFRACAESLASENASRLAAMQRADKNIDELLEDLNQTFHRLRQNGIDEELFDVISGFEALSGKER
jgi:F-type H+-transporting ATPase subunit gamma